jgi:hypothetical protein
VNTSEEKETKHTQTKYKINLIITIEIITPTTPTTPTTTTTTTIQKASYKVSLDKRRKNIYKHVE